jgi:hypothetical protein
MKFALVDVSSITCSTDRSTIAEDRIQGLAQAIVAAGGLAQPLLLTMTGIDEYAVVNDPLAFYAMVEAKKVNHREFEMTNAFIVKADNVQNVTLQSMYY